MPNPSTIGIKQLKIMLKTGIPGQDEHIEFTSSLLPIKGKFAKYPFFSDTHAYPKIKLQDYTYERIVEFFFNKEVFTKLMRNKTQKNIPNVSQQKIKIDNFELTLRLLFPTTYPLVNNIDNSVEYIIPSKKIFTLKGSNTFSVLPRRFDRKYSYLNIGPETYTITKTVWNNDVLNHPVYGKFIQTYKEFDDWKADPSLNIFQKKTAIEDNMNVILSYVFDSVQKSDEDVLFKKMYEDVEKAPYYSSANSNKRLDESTLAIQDFDNAIDELMRKDVASLQSDIGKLETEYAELYKKLETLVPPPTQLLESITQKHESLENINHEMYEKFKSSTIKEIDKSKIDKVTKTSIIEIVNEIISVLELLQKNKQSITKLKLNKKTTAYNYYKFFQKKTNKDEIKPLREEFLNNNYKYKSDLITLLGKLTVVKTDNYHNVSPDLLNLLDYLKTNVTDFNIKRRIFTFINDLNIKFLSHPKYKTDLEKIQSTYVEFYNLALVINGLKGRKIDNQIWRDAVFKMMNGSLEENYFNDKIWEPLRDCYHLDDDVEENPDSKSKKKKSGKKCDPDVISVGLDIIPLTKQPTLDDKKKPTTNVAETTIQTVEVYLQMDIIEGKIDDTNVSKIKCAYDDAFLGSMFRDLINSGKQINTFPSEQVFFSAKKLLSDIATADKKNAITPRKNGGKSKKRNHRTRKNK